jgi:hypothetical protein
MSHESNGEFVRGVISEIRGKTYTIRLNEPYQPDGDEKSYTGLTQSIGLLKEKNRFVGKRVKLRKSQLDEILLELELRRNEANNIAVNLTEVEEIGAGK